MSDKSLKIMVLAGGPDRERPVSLQSGQQVASALIEAGHQVILADITPDNLKALDEFEAWSGDAIFTAMHGSWGEGGGLQYILDQRQLPYLGCTAQVANLCMDKWRTKRVLESHYLPTPSYQVVERDMPFSIQGPVVIKPLREGSSIDILICKDPSDAANEILRLLKTYPRLLVEQFIDGMEMTVGMIGGPKGDRPLPPVQIISNAEFYDYEAKYTRNDTQYLFDIDLPKLVLERISEMASKAHRVLGCRHLSRVDFMVDRLQQPWILEVNTIPGFTSHSLVPKAAAYAGIAWVDLVDRLARLACGRFTSQTGQTPDGSLDAGHSIAQTIRLSA